MSNCSLCKVQIPDSSFEAWTTPEGNVVEVARSEAASGIVDTSVGEVQICEACYLRGVPVYFTLEDLAGIHYQFGLEYRDLGRFSRSVECLEQARLISETPDILAALGHVESELGHRDVSVSYYRRALEIDGTHFLSRENLKNLYGQA